MKKEKAIIYKVEGDWVLEGPHGCKAHPKTLDQARVIAKKNGLSMKRTPNCDS
jgi:hypothetical protein